MRNNFRQEFENIVNVSNYKEFLNRFGCDYSPAQLTTMLRNAVRSACSKRYGGLTVSSIIGNSFCELIPLQSTMTWDEVNSFSNEEYLMKIKEDTRTTWIRRRKELKQLEKKRSNSHDSTDTNTSSTSSTNNNNPNSNNSNNNSNNNKSNKPNSSNKPNHNSNHPKNGNNSNNWKNYNHNYNNNNGNNNSNSVEKKELKDQSFGFANKSNRGDGNSSQSEGRYKKDNNYHSRRNSTTTFPSTSHSNPNQTFSRSDADSNWRKK